MPERAPDVEVVLVTYFSRGLVEELLADLPADLPIAIVDNANGGDAIHELVEGRPNARYQRGGGVGFARAANLGARTSTHRFVLFLNPDTRPTAEQLMTLVRDLEADDTLASVAATTVTPDGRVELGAGGWEPTVTRALVYATGLHSLFPRAGLYARPEPLRPLRPEWLSGACLAVDRERFLALGGFDEQFFLYNEDMSYGRRVRQAGLGQRLRTDVLVPHAGGGSGGAKPVMLQMRGASMTRYLSSYHRGLEAVAIRLVLTAGAMGRLGVCRARGRADAASGFASYIKGLWRGAPSMGS